MKITMTRLSAGGLLLAGLTPALAGCQTTGTAALSEAVAPRVVAVAPHTAAYTPELAAVEPEVQTSENTPFNQWGGQVPDAMPSTPVDGDGLGEIE